MRFRRTCEEVHRMVCESLDHRLPLTTRLVMRLHLAACDACTNFRGQLNLLRDAMRKIDDQ